MVLKKVEICGFKSFPDKTVLDFPDGITAIVGSNGCGKSNVSDAVRWVLGEQSAKSLRGDKMEDLIFSGTATRKPMNFAEVILTFDNSKKLFPLEFNEVSIGRRLFRDGESCYLLNRQECRLRDIYDLLMDSGIGRRAHSIIEQGKIEEIVMARPEERRHLIEEAAGIAKYRSRRAEALRRLESTREGLQRVDDLIAEMDRQEQSLRRQSKKAERFREIESDLKLYELVSARLHLSEIDANIATLSDSRRMLTDQLTELEVETGAVALEIESLKLRLESERNETRESGRRLSDAEKAYSAAESKLTELKARQTDDSDAIMRLNRELEALEARIQESTRMREEALREIKNYEEKLHTLVTVRAELELTNASERSEIDSMRRAVSDCGARVNGFNESIAKLESGIEYGSRHAAELEARARGIEDAIERMAAERSAIEANVTAWEIASDELRLSRGELDESCASLDRELADCAVSRESVLNELSETERRHENAMTRLAAATSLAELTAQEAALASAELGVELISVAELPLCDRVHAPALRAALSELRSGVLAADGADDRLSAVAERLRGRAVLGSVSSAHDAWMPTRGMTPLASLLAEHAPAPLAAALSGWYFAETSGDAEKMLSELDVRERIVTAAGDVFYPFGARKLHRVDEVDESVVSRGLLEEEANALNDAIVELQLRLTSLRQEEDSLLARRRDVLERSNSLQSRFVELTTRIDGGRRRIESLNDEPLRAELAAAVEEREAALCGAAERSAELSSARAGLGAEKSCFDALREELDELERAAEAARGRAGELMREESALKERKASRAREEERLALWIGESSSALERQSQMRDEIASRRDERVLYIERLNREAGELAAGLESRRAEFAMLESKCRESEIELDAALDRSQLLAKRREDSRNELHGQDVREVQLASEKSMVLTRISEKYGTTDLSAVAAPVDEDGTTLDLAAVTARVEEFKEMLKRMGGVNFAAADELGEVVTRLDFFRKQREDLSKAESGLAEVVRDIDQQTKTLFNETFNAVNANFNLLFNRLFGARGDMQGAAELVLLDPSNPLESGIDIIAMPPGKKPQTISLLSGGEKALTAVSLLFSIFLVRPSPFAVLDELDAPLDEANVGKYVQLLKEFSQRSQFIIITHNKRTMEAADTLYGVSQSEKGISRLVGVRLDEKEALPEAAG